MTIASTYATNHVPISIPIRFASPTDVIVSDGHDGFLPLPFPPVTFGAAWLAEVKERWTNLVEPIEIIDLGPPRLPAHPKSSEHWAGNTLKVRTADGDDVPLLGALGAFRPAYVFRTVDGGTVELLFEQGLTFLLAPLSAPYSEPLAVIYWEEFFDLRPHLEALRDARRAAASRTS
jgi:hypothetical protein